MQVIVGNIISLVGCLLMVAIGFVKQKRKILPLQCVQFAIQGAANLVLGGVSGTICNVVGILRNLVFLKWKGNVVWKVFFILLQVVLTFLFDGFALPVWLPILAAVIFTWFIDVKSEAAFKVVMITGQVLWLVYDVIHLNYVAVAFDTFSTASNLIALISILRAKK